MKQLKQIIQDLKKLIEEEKLKIEDKDILDFAVRIRNTQKMNPEPVKNEDWKNEPATEKQRWLLKKAKENGAFDGDIENITKVEATTIIRELKEKYG